MTAVKHGFSAKQLVLDGRVAEPSIELLKAWLATQRTIPQITDEQIVIFLLACGNDTEMAKKTIECFYEHRLKTPQLFNDRSVFQSDIQLQLNTVSFCVFPKRTDDGSAIIFSKLNDTYYYNAVMLISLKIFFMLTDSVVYDTPPTGLIVLIDLQGLGLMHLTKLKMGLIKTACDYYQNGLPVALRKVHVLNTVYFMNKVMNLVRPFLSKQTLDLINFHDSNIDMDEFYEKCIPKKYLPQEYGGDLPPIRTLHEQTVRRLDDLKEYFDAEEVQRRSHR